MKEKECPICKGRKTVLIPPYPYTTWEEVSQAQKSRPGGVAVIGGALVPCRCTLDREGMTTLTRDDFIDQIKQNLSPDAFFYIGAHGDVYARDGYRIIDLACLIPPKPQGCKFINCTFNGCQSVSIREE